MNAEAASWCMFSWDFFVPSTRNAALGYTSLCAVSRLANAIFNNDAAGACQDKGEMYGIHLAYIVLSYGRHEDGEETNAVACRPSSLPSIDSIAPMIESKEEDLSPIESAIDQIGGH